MQEPTSVLHTAIDADNIPAIVRALESVKVEAQLEPVPPVVELLRHRSHAVREAAVGALGRMGEVSALPLLLELATKQHEGNRHVRCAAVKALGSFTGPDVELALTAALNDQALNVRAGAEGSLRLIRGAKAGD
jgi:HEAT repeat protein